MSRSKRKKKTKLCYCGERIELNNSNRAGHDMCERDKPKRILEMAEYDYYMDEMGKSETKRNKCQP